LTGPGHGANFGLPDRAPHLVTPQRSTNEAAQRFDLIHPRRTWLRLILVGVLFLISLVQNVVNGVGGSSTVANPSVAVTVVNYPAV
jgi:hypothetical protein